MHVPDAALQYGFAGRCAYVASDPPGATPLAAEWPYANLPSEPPVNSGRKGNAMAWTTPTLVEICIGLEINGYLPAEF